MNKSRESYRKMVQCRVVTTALLSLFLVHAPGCSRKVSLQIPPTASLAFSFRLAASPDIDLALVAEARATEDQDVFRDGNLVASWVPVAATKQEELEDNVLISAHIEEAVLLLVGMRVECFSSLPCRKDCHEYCNE